MTLTIELPENVGAQIAADAEANGTDAATAITLMLTTLYQAIEPEAVEGVKRGLADMEAGRTISLEDALAQHEAASRKRGTLP